MRFIVPSLACLVLVTILLTGCSSETTAENSAIELVSSFAEIRERDIRIPVGELEGEIYQEVSLNYKFVLKNISNETLGVFHLEDGLDLSIEPNDKLKKILKEVLDNDDLKGIGFGRYGGMPKIEPGNEEEYNLFFKLGYNKENPFKIQIAPPKKQLDRLERNAMEATLVVSIEGKEIEKFDLSKKIR